MATTDTSRRLQPRIIRQDIESLHGLRTIDNYITGRSAATPEALQAAYDAMLENQQKETEMLTLVKAANDTRG